MENSTLKTVTSLLGNAIDEKVKKLSLHSFNLEEWPSKLFELETLETLYISKNLLSHIPEDIVKLKNLKYLNISNNLIYKIPSFINELPSLTELFLTSNKIKDFPIELFLCKKLKTIGLSSNQIEYLPTNFNENSTIRTIFLGGNNIKLLPKEFVQHLKLHVLDLSDNSLDSPPIEIVNQGVPAIRNYFHSINEAKEIYTLYEAKLLLVGEGYVGKTCLMNRLINNKDFDFDNIKSTEGIVINHWFLNTNQTNDFKINIWDFGGQEIYHATHQFFLTKRSLYLLLWIARTDDNLVSFDYWLNVINLLSNKAPIIIVLNKIDERFKPINEYAITKKFTNVVNFHKISAKNNSGIVDLVKSIKDEVDKLPHIGEELPKVWIDIRKELESTNKNYLSLNHYLEICEKYNLDREKALFLSRYFHDLGVFLHFQDNEILYYIIFLKPEWVTNAVYNLVDNDKLKETNGRFYYNDLKNIWVDYNEDNYLRLIELMNKFELCFKIGKKAYLVPGLLSEKRPTDAFLWKSKDNIEFEYHYDFMPSGIITRFIVRNSDLIDRNSYWKNGVILKQSDSLELRGIEQKKETFALIQSLPFDRKIKIKIRGDKKNSLLSIIRREFTKIHRTLNNPKTKEMIPCNCKVCKDIQDKTLFDYGELQIYLESREFHTFCTLGRVKVNIGKLLQDFDLSENLQLLIKNINIKGGTTQIADQINN